MPEVRGAIVSSYFLVLILSGSALWGVPVPYPDAAQCDAAGLAWREVNRVGRHYYCVTAPIVTGENVNRQFKRDSYPAMKCVVEAINPSGPGGGTKVVCE